MDSGQSLMTELLKGQWGHRRLVVEVPVLMDLSQSKPVSRNLKLAPQYNCQCPFQGPYSEIYSQTLVVFIDAPGFCSITY